MGYVRFKRDRPSQLTQAISTLYPLPGNNFHQHPPLSREHKGRGEENGCPMKFFSFWRSLASFRVRIALNLKTLPAEVIFVDLDTDAHRTEEYRRVNPQMALPSLVEDDGTTLFQSLAIIEYLEEKHPAPPLLPPDAPGRARVRALALMVACEGHPLLTPRVRRYLGRELNLRDTQQAAWRRT